MSLTTKIKEIVNTLFPDATYYLASQLRANINTESISSDQLPLIILDNAIKKTATIQPNANTLKEHELILYFLDKVNFDTSDENENAKIEVLELMADKVMNNVYQLEDVRVGRNNVQQYSTEPVFKIFNSLLSGVKLRAKYNYNQIIPFCNGTGGGS